VRRIVGDLLFPFANMRIFGASTMKASLHIGLQNLVNEFQVNRIEDAWISPAFKARLYELVIVDCAFEEITSEVLNQIRIIFREWARGQSTILERHQIIADSALGGMIASRLKDRAWQIFKEHWESGNPDQVVGHKNYINSNFKLAVH
jgi:hypothetical protein